LALERNEPVICNVAEAAREFPQLSYKLSANAKFSISVPLAQNGARFVLHLFFSEDPPNAEQLAARIGELAAKIRPALVRKLSEERIALLQSVALNANDAAMVLMPESSVDPDAALHIVYVNPAMERLTLYPAAELIGKRPSLLWGAGPTAPLEGVGPLRQELLCRRRDGSEFWADVSTSPANDGGGERRVIAMLRDMTMRRSLEEALREREHTFRLMFSRAPVPTMLIDVKSGRYVEVNDAAVELFGYTREQLLTMTAEEIRAPEEVDRYRATRKTPVPASGRRGLWRYLKADGSAVLVDVSVHPFRSQGRAMAIIVTVDVTEQKRIEEQFRLARDSAEAMSRAKSDLLANMSHELRTPLNAIIGFSEIMREELFGPLGSARYGGYIGDVLESAQHLLAVINDILDLAKIEANSFRLREAPVDPDAVVASAIRLVRARADEAGIAVRFDNQAPSVAISADETALKRVLVNLLANAVKFSESGTLVTVRASVTNEGGLALAVEDLGIGMAAEDIPVALMPFQQVQNGMRRKYEGTGLGLPIAKQLVELHGGQLTIESQRGIGTTVTMTLPPWRILGEAPWPHLAALAG
jgi:PAS domain S-box-containing protein